MIENVAPNSAVHGVPLGIHNYRVSIDVCFDDDALLPITIADDPLNVTPQISGFFFSTGNRE